MNGCFIIKVVNVGLVNNKISLKFSDGASGSRHDWKQSRHDWCS